MLLVPCKYLFELSDQKCCLQSAPAARVVVVTDPTVSDPLTNLREVEVVEAQKHVSNAGKLVIGLMVGKLFLQVAILSDPY
jgi:hypothetical protein